MGRSLMLVLFPLSIILMTNIDSTAQERTGATESKKEHKRKKKDAPKKQKLRYIVKNDTKNILYGNKCFLDVQRECGFEYLVQPKGQPLNRNELSRNLHNFGVKFVLIFRNGPFWPITVNKRKKECRRQSGDFVGGQ